ncbi:hypothetical protein SLE2022_098690 [Rubroshorea leprosula]
MNLNKKENQLRIRNLSFSDRKPPLTARKEAESTGKSSENVEMKRNRKSIRNFRKQPSKFSMGILCYCDRLIQSMKLSLFFLHKLPKDEKSEASAVVYMLLNTPNKNGPSSLSFLSPHIYTRIPSHVTPESTVSVLPHPSTAVRSPPMHWTELSDVYAT